jgi:hypothetical protein
MKSEYGTGTGMSGMFVYPLRISGRCDMKVTIQLYAESGNWATPTGEDCIKCESLKDALDNHFCHWVSEVSRFDDEQCAKALVWFGHYDDVTDLYPDYEIVVGPRGGYQVRKV